MLSKGNGSPVVCVNNLLKIARGENPYDRVKGISAANIDGPVSQAGEDIVEDAEWMLGTYEPRAEVESVKLTADNAQLGQFRITANIKTTKEADE